MSEYRLYFGDLHNHCAISYGHGSLQRALALARQQLDFCSVTGHAFWPDMPSSPAVSREDIDYHLEGFARLKAAWPQVQKVMQAANEPGRFVTFPSYEWHSIQDGDHHVVYADVGGELIGGSRIAEVKAALRSATEARSAPAAIAIPHHLGYPAGCRGVNWEVFDAGMSPFVEVYSLHGCAESDDAPFPMLHVMGPRVAAHTASEGLRRGYRFGLVASTDHHSGYPGSHGFGRLGVYASALTRAALWEAFLSRRVYAVTGDRIRLELRVNGAPMGAEVHADGPGGSRQVDVDVQACDWIDYVELLKNERLLARWPGPDPAAPPTIGQGPVRARVRIEWGWGDPARSFSWNVRLSLEDGALRGVETCFSGPAVVMPLEDPQAAGDDDALPHRVTEQTAQSCAWNSRTTGNPTVRHSATQALIADVEMPPAATLHLEANDHHLRATLGELLAGSRGRALDGLLSPAIVLHHAVPAGMAHLRQSYVDMAAPGDANDWYRLRVCQRNGQWAWSSPIWVVS